MNKVKFSVSVVYENTQLLQGKQELQLRAVIVEAECGAEALGIGIVCIEDAEKELKGNGYKIALKTVVKIEE